MVLFMILETYICECEKNKCFLQMREISVIHHLYSLKPFSILASDVCYINLLFHNDYCEGFLISSISIT